MSSYSRSPLFCDTVYCSVHLSLFGCVYSKDGGAGIGRVTKKLLLPLFDTVDLVEQNSGFLVKSHEFLVSFPVATYVNRDFLFFHVQLVNVPQQRMSDP